MARWLLALPAALPLALFLALVPPAPAGHAADNGSWSVFPYAAKDAGPAPREFFFLQAPAGGTVKDKATVANGTAGPVTFQLYGADAYNTADGGGYALRGIDEKQTDIGSWTTLDRTAVTVPAHSRIDVPFTVRIPGDATPGDHPGGIVALNTAVAGMCQDGQVRIGVKRAVGARVHLRVDGPAVPAVAVEDVRVSHTGPIVPWPDGGTATVRYRLVNRGNVTVRPWLSTKATGLFGGTLRGTGPRDLDLDLLPGQSATLTEHWPDAPQFNRANLTLTVTSEEDGLRESAGASFWAVPWISLVVLLALAAGSGTLLWWRRRTREAGPTGGAAPPNPARPTATCPASRTGPH